MDPLASTPPSRATERVARGPWRRAAGTVRTYGSHLLGLTRPIGFASLLALAAFAFAGCASDDAGRPIAPVAPSPVPAAEAAGACCFFDGSCVVLTEEDCLAQEGTFAGEETSCDPNPCPQPEAVGACCFASGYCELFTVAECGEAGGTYQGDASACDPNPCPPPLPPGACCYPDGSCAVRTADVCDQEGGIFAGENTPCGPRSCVAVRDEGCGAAYWRSHRTAWKHTSYRPTHRLGRIFVVPRQLRGMADDRLLTALYYANGPGLRGGARILLRAAIVGVLNASHPDVNYPLTESELVARTNEALASLDRGRMVALAREIRAHNRLGCPLSK